MPRSFEVRRNIRNNLLESSALLTQRTAYVTDGAIMYTYLGVADPGSDENDPVWSIQRYVVYPDNTTTLLFANGSVSFSQRWTDHASLSYR